MGARRHKKKIYTTPKRQKHVRKKSKLPILKLYKVSEDGEEVERQRDECPQPSCGAGMFMADHKDRLYCGKCHHTIFKKTEGKAGKQAK